MTGLYLVEQSAARDDLIIFGSCQSLIHALSIAASGDALTGRRVVLITSPQSYVEEGIAPDLFMANFSPQQYLALMRSPDLTPEIKRYLSGRVRTLFARYESLPDTGRTDPAIRALAEYGAQPTALAAARNTLLTPYYTFSGYLYGLRDRITSRALLQSAEDSPAAGQPEDLVWAEAGRAALTEAERMTDNNDFGILNDYYTTYIGTRLARQRDRDHALSYAVSEEYDDLRALFEVCRQKGVEPLFVHVPLHGQWSDYTGFSADRRARYYQCFPPGLLLQKLHRRAGRPCD